MGMRRGLDSSAGRGAAAHQTHSQIKIAKAYPARALCLQLQQALAHLEVQAFAKLESERRAQPDEGAVGRLQVVQPELII